MTVGDLIYALSDLPLSAVVVVDVDGNKWGAHAVRHETMCRLVLEPDSFVQPRAIGDEKLPPEGVVYLSPND